MLNWLDSWTGEVKSRDGMVNEPVATLRFQNFTFPTLLKPSDSQNDHIDHSVTSLCSGVIGPEWDIVNMTYFALCVQSKVLPDPDLSHV